MKNTIGEKPSTQLNGRTKFTVNFVETEDIKGKKILDIGCGYGWCELNFLERGAKEIYATEVSENDLETIKTHLKDKRVRIKVANATDLPFEKNTFDTVVSWEVIEHIPKNTEQKMFSEARRVLKPGGAFYLSTPYRSFLSTAFDPAWWLIGHRHYSRNKLFALARENGFEVDKVTVRGRVWNLLSILDMYMAKWVFRRKPPYEKFIMSKIDEEFEREGFMNIFVKFKKV